MNAPRPIATYIAVSLSLLGTAGLGWLRAKAEMPFLFFAPVLLVGVAIDWMRLTQPTLKEGASVALVTLLFAATVIAGLGVGPRAALLLALVATISTAALAAWHVRRRHRTRVGEYLGEEDGYHVFSDGERRYVLHGHPLAVLRIRHRYAFTLRAASEKETDGPFRNNGTVHGELMDASENPSGLRSRRVSTGLAAVGAAAGAGAFAAVTLLLLGLS